MTWRQFVMDLGSLPADEVEAMFEQHGALAVTLTDAADEAVLEPLPGETPLWSETRITGLFPASADVDALRQDLLRSFRLAELPRTRVETLEDRAWEREWLRDFRPMRFGRRLWVCPGGAEAGDSDAVALRLDPGLAFGTGTHETTAMCLEWLDAQDLAGRRVLDYGCGSGILAVAALLLGAKAAAGVDIDPQALTAARANANRNGVGDRLLLAPPDTLPAAAPRFDVVVANILAGPLAELAPALCRHLLPGGIIALSGILEHQADEVFAAYSSRISFEPPVVRASWVRLTGTRR